MSTLLTSWGTQYYRAEGASWPAVVFLHGTGCDSEDWHTTLQHLASPTTGRLRLHTVLMDFRGHGRSSVPETRFQLRDLADDVLYLIAHLGLDRVLVVGHSLGGMVALDAAARSRAIAGVVLLEGWTSLQAARAFGANRFYGGLSLQQIERIRQKDAATRGRFSPQVWSHFWRSVACFDGWNTLVHASIPIVETYGALGRNADTQAYLRVPDSRFIDWLWVPGAGHYLPHERPDYVATACIRGLTSI